MEELVDYYGHKVRGDGYPLASQIWGHRLRGGQHWMEYLLEFLNVLAGFDYRLGQGLDDQRGTANYLDEYSRFTRLGLRRFVFYDEREKTTHPYDDRAIKALLSALKTRVSGTGFDSHEEELTLVRSLFRSFSAVEEERAWFAKSLFPCIGYLAHPFLKRKRSEEKNQTGVILGNITCLLSCSLALLFCRPVSRYREEHPKTACRRVSTDLHQKVG